MRNNYYGVFQDLHQLKSEGVLVVTKQKYDRDQKDLWDWIIGLRREVSKLRKQMKELEEKKQ